MWGETKEFGRIKRVIVAQILSLFELGKIISWFRDVMENILVTVWKNQTHLHPNEDSDVFPHLNSYDYLMGWQESNFGLHQ